MLKQVTVAGRQLELHSVDGKVWCSRIADVITMRKRKAELEKHIKTISSHIYLKRVNDRFGADSEDYLYVHFGRGQWNP